MEIDLHTHSIYSDGQNTPEELIEMATNLGLKYYSLTDHDSIEGVKELIKLNHDNLNIYSGVELSAEYPNGQMHILGYNFDVENEELNEKLEYLKKCSIDNMNGYIKQLKDNYNITLPKEDLDDLFTSSNLHRPMLALLLVKNGHCKDVTEAFDKFLKDGKAEKKISGLPAEECLRLINNAGGVAILAHPWTLKLSNADLKKNIKYLVSKGLSGIEVYHSGNSEKQIKFYKNIAKEFDLITTGGTDYHGPRIKPEIKLGRGKDNLNINEKDINITERITSRY